MDAEEGPAAMAGNCAAALCSKAREGGGLDLAVEQVYGLCTSLILLGAVLDQVDWRHYGCPTE